MRVHLDPIDERAAFRALIDHALAQVGCQQRLLSDSGLEILRMASQGRPRQAGLILRTAMKLAVPRALNYLPDDLLQDAIEALR